MLDKENFNNIIISKYKDSELAKIVSENSECEFYELCQSYLDISLNAPKIRTEDGSIAGVFQYSDINIAKQKTIRFFKSYGISDLDSFFNILEDMYPHTVANNDKRQKAALIKEDNCNYTGYFGTFYSFTHISDDIYQRIVSEIKQDLLKSTALK